MAVLLNMRLFVVSVFGVDAYGNYEQKHCELGATIERRFRQLNAMRIHHKNNKKNNRTKQNNLVCYEL